MKFQIYSEWRQIFTETILYCDSGFFSFWFVKFNYLLRKQNIFETILTAGFSIQLHETELNNFKEKSIK